MNLALHRPRWGTLLHPLLPAAASVAYLAMAALWIAHSDAALVALTDDAAEISRWQTAKGLGFVSVAALLLFALLTWARRELLRVPAAERLVLDLSRQYRSLVEMSPDAIVLHSRGSIIYANPAFRSALGLPRQASIKGSRLTHLLAPEDREFLERRLARLAEESGVAAPAALRIRTLAGRELEVEHVSCSQRVAGELVVQSHFRDCTAQNRAHRDLEAVNQRLEALVAERTARLEDANDALEAFARSVAHDLRAPAARAAMFAQLAQRKIGSDPAQAAHFAGRAFANAQLLHGMLDSLLQLCRVGSGELAVQHVDCEALVRDVAAELAPDGRPPLQVGSLPTAEADPTLLRHVWFNLLSNAIKYSSTREAPRVEVGGSVADGVATYWVRDNGVGFDPAEAPALFKPFSRLTSAHGFSGTGVGLSIVERAVHRHGGHAWAESLAAGGAAFFFSLPGVRPREAGAGP